MRKYTNRHIEKAVQLLTVITSVILLSILFYTLGKILKPVSAEAREDGRQIEEMENYHWSQGRTNLLFFN